MAVFCNDNAMITGVLLAVMASSVQLQLAEGTSMKLDFLRLTNVRTDPITNPTGLSPHLHSFFGAARAAPNTKYADLRSSKGNTGNVNENKSLYWHPTIYKYDKGSELFTIQDTSLFSTYYIWETGKVKAFPDGLKMIGGGYQDRQEAMQFAECVNPGRCPGGDCERWNNFFPATTCDELEMSMRMPSCWDGKNLDSKDHRSHVAYPSYSDPDGECPASHPVQLPQIRVFTRIMPYTGGIHLFSDGTGFFHADYFSGWDANFLQTVLDQCNNDSFDAMPTDWCENHVTFLDAPKNPKSTEVDKEKLKSLQPKSPFDTSSITSEKIDGVKVLPGGVRPRKSFCYSISKQNKCKRESDSCVWRAGDCVPKDAETPAPATPQVNPIPCSSFNRKASKCKRQEHCQYVKKGKRCTEASPSDAEGAGGSEGKNCGGFARKKDCKGRGGCRWKRRKCISK